jgi:hypothetical protein
VSLLKINSALLARLNDKAIFIATGFAAILRLLEAYKLSAARFAVSLVNFLAMVGFSPTRRRAVPTSAAFA